MSSKRPPTEALTTKHDLSGFDCGGDGLNRWLKKFALLNQRNESSRTFVTHKDGAVCGYYSLAAGSVSRAEATGRAAKGPARHPVPVIIITRLAVERRMQGRGIGAALLKDALMRCASAAKTIGVRAVLVHAVDDGARSFYEKYGFERSSISEFTLMLLMKDLRASL